MGPRMIDSDRKAQQTNGNGNAAWWLDQERRIVRITTVALLGLLSWIGNDIRQELVLIRADRLILQANTTEISSLRRDVDRQDGRLTTLEGKHSR